MLDNPADSMMAPKAPRSASLPLINALIGLVFVLIVAALAMIAWQMLSEPPVPRTSAERDLARFELEVKQHKADPIAHASYGEAFMQVGSYAGAVKEFKKAIKLSPGDSRYYVLLAKAYAAQNDVQPAIVALTKAKKLDENSEEAWFIEGKIAYDQKDYRKAITAWTKSMELQPSASDVHFLAGQAFEKTSQTDAAMAHYREALKYMPDYPEAREALQRLEGSQGNN